MRAAARGWGGAEIRPQPGHLALGGACPGRGAACRPALKAGTPGAQLSEPEALFRASLEPLPQMGCRQAGKEGRHS